MRMPLKAAELHRVVRRELGPMFSELGFRRTPKASMASWLRSEGDQWLVVWFQPSRSNDDASPGFAFTVELSLGDEPVIGGRGFRRRVPALLTPDELEQLRTLENRTVAKLPPPSRDIARMLPPDARERWLSSWRPRNTPYAPGTDIWFRHQDEADLAGLLELMQRVLPAVIERFCAAAAAAPAR
jgi:hypothetical protein